MYEIWLCGDAVAVLLDAAIAGSILNTLNGVALVVSFEAA